MNREQRRRIVLAPLGIWAALLALLSATVAYAYVPHAPGKLVASLSISVAKALLIALLFMQLRRSAGVVRLASLAGLIWCSFLYILVFADVWTR